MTAERTRVPDLTCGLLPAGSDVDASVDAGQAATAGTRVAATAPARAELVDASELGILAVHPGVAVEPLRVAPTTADQVNTLELDLRPVGCVGLADGVFEFDSSFVLPHAAPLLARLPEQRLRHRTAVGMPPVSIFGHADPVGTDVYNKELSGRRARAVLGLLTHDAGRWVELHDHPFGGDDWRAKGVLAVMRRATGLPATSPLRTVIAAYMQALVALPLTAADLLGQGADPEGKADCQGCGEFNPLVILARGEDQSLSRAERNAANLPNRRVLIFLYPPGSRVVPAAWPCPTAKEPPTGCRARFFADGDLRRAAGPERRERHDVSDRTFACRFYARMADASPCERAPTVIRIRLFDPQGNALPAAPFQLELGTRTVRGRAKGDAFLTVVGTDIPATATLRWSRPQQGDRPDSPPPGPATGFDFTLELNLAIQEAAEAGAQRRLHNLGYTLGPKPADDVAAFQRDYQQRLGLQVTGTLDAATIAGIQRVHDSGDVAPKQPRPATQEAAR